VTWIRPSARPLIAACLLAAAGLLAFEAHAVLGARAAIERSGTRELIALGGADVPVPRSAPRVGRLEQRLLGLDGLPGTRAALDGLVRASSARKPAQSKRALAAAQAALTGVIGSHAPGARRSAAANLLGVLLFEQGQTAQSVGAFTRSVRLDAANDAAKLNLELALALTHSGSKQSSHHGKAKTQQPTGAGTSPPGSGY
jgi:hypothetical protein